MGVHEWVCPVRASEFHNVSKQTLRNWARLGKIGHKQTAGGHFRYLLQKPDDAECHKYGIVYARVSSSKQKSDLGRQIDYLRTRFPDHVVVSDVGSGVNFSRPGLCAILEQCMRGLVSEVVVTYRDRLARIGTELVEFIIARGGAILTVLEHSPCIGCPEELAEDVLAVLTHFTARHNGR